MNNNFDADATPYCDSCNTDDDGNKWMAWGDVECFERRARVAEHELRIERKKIISLKSLVLEMLTDLEIQREPLMVIGKVVVHESKTFVASCLLRLILKQIDEVGI
jgi:hypothetical protein